MPQQLIEEISMHLESALVYQPFYHFILAFYKIAQNC